MLATQAKQLVGRHLQPDKVLTVNSDTLTAEQMMQAIEEAGFKIKVA